MKLYIDFSDFEPWSDAVDTWEKIKDADRLDEFETMLDECYPEGMSETQLNDLLWLESEWCLELVGLRENKKEEIDDAFDIFCGHFTTCSNCPLENYGITIIDCEKCIKNNKDNFLKCINGQKEDEYNKEIISF